MNEEDVEKLQNDLKGYEAEVANTLRVSPSILNNFKRRFIPTSRQAQIKVDGNTHKKTYQRRER